MNIIVGRNGKETVSKIAEEIGATVYSRHFLRRGGMPWRVNFGKMEMGYQPKLSGLTIKWAYSPHDLSVDGTVINNTGIPVASDKYRARVVLKNAGVSIPETTDSVDEALKWVSEGATVIGRPFSHRSGMNFYVIKSGSDLSSARRGCGYYSKFFPKTNEFRVHVGHGKVLLCQEKTPRDSNVDLVSPKPWNHATGDFVFATQNWSDYIMSVVKTACDAVKALGLDMGAVDVMYDKNTDTAVITEVNTSPSLEDYAVSRYSKYFKWIERNNGGEHWDYTKYTKAKSYAWTNGQLDGTGDDE